MIGKTLNFCFTLIFAMFAVTACEKSQEPSNEPQQTAAGNKEQGSGKKERKIRESSLLVFQEDRLLARIEPAEFQNLMKTNVSVGGKQYPAILLTDLLKKYNAVGNTIMLGGLSNSTSITSEQANLIYAYTDGSRMRLYATEQTQNRIPKILVRINVLPKG